MASGFKLVPRTQVPHLGSRRDYGLNVRVFDALYDARPGFVAEVPVKSDECGRHLAQRLKTLAKKHRCVVDWDRSPDCKIFYFWLEKR